MMACPPPTITASRGTTVPFLWRGGSLRSLRVKYRSQGVHASFYESNASTQDTLGRVGASNLDVLVK